MTCHRSGQVVPEGRCGAVAAGGYSGRQRRRRSGIGGCLRRGGAVLSVGLTRGETLGGSAFRLLVFEQHGND